MRIFARIEWPTVLLFLVAYAAWGFAVFRLPEVALWPAIGVAAIVIALHSSLQHEAMHGHPTEWPAANTALAWPPLTMVIPWLRFRDTHLDHHRDAFLTDPYDDPETNFMDLTEWNRLPRALQVLRLANNTLAGRLILGPLIGTACFLRSELRAARTDARVARGWLWHLPAAAAVAAAVAVSPMPVWGYALAVYGALALLRIRTFLEHQAHQAARARSVIIEDRGPLALLFLNNNLHAVHHAHPGLAWYRLPAFYRAHRDRFLTMNEGYRFASYAEVFRDHFFRRKDPVAHPLLVRGRTTGH
jgi:fatty acid desaturase